MKCAQIGPSRRVGVKTGLGEAIRIISCDHEAQLMRPFEARLDDDAHAGNYEIGSIVILIAGGVILAASSVTLDQLARKG